MEHDHSHDDEEVRPGYVMKHIPGFDWPVAVFADGAISPYWTPPYAPSAELAA